MAGISFGIFRYIKADESLKKTNSIIAEYTYASPLSLDEAEYSIDVESLVDIEGLQKENQDVTGYIKIPDTVISYPVMHSEKPGYYLTHDFNGKKSVYGSIYVDSACYDNGQVTLIHGHNMKNGTMFGGLRKYRDEEYAASHENLWYTTKDGIYIYQQCALFDASVKNEDIMKCVVPYTGSEFNELKEYIENNGTIRKDFTWNDNLLILSTCVGNNKNTRMYVVFKKVQAIKGGKENVKAAD